MHDPVSGHSPLGRAFRTLVPQNIRSGTFALDDSAMPDDVDPVLAVLLRGSVKDVIRWAAAPARERGALFSRDDAIRRTADLSRASIPAVVQGPLRIIRDLLVRPDAIPAARLSTACGTIARWASQENYTRLSMAYREAAAVTLPDSPLAAIDLARTFADLAQWHAAEEWLNRAESLAERAGDAEMGARVLIIRAEMMLTRGRYSEGEEMLGEVVRRAQACRADAILGSALHGLCWVTARCGRLVEADGFAERAFETYGNDHPNLPLLLHEVAFIRLERGEFVSAIPLLTALAPITPPHPRVGVLGSLARAAGGAGDEALFEEARDALDESMMNKRTAEAWLETARGALLLGDPDEARELAERALIIAMERGEARTRYLAEDYLDAIESEASAALAVRNTTRSSEAVQSLTTRLLASLQPHRPRE